MQTIYRSADALKSSSEKWSPAHNKWINIVRCENPDVQAAMTLAQVWHSKGTDIRKFMSHRAHLDASSAYESHNILRCRWSLQTQHQKNENTPVINGRFLTKMCVGAFFVRCWLEWYHIHQSTTVPAGYVCLQKASTVWIVQIWITLAWDVKRVEPYWWCSRFNIAWWFL